MNAQPEQRTPEWHESRVGKITASRVGAILGLSKYRTAADVLRDMVREHFGMPREFVGNEATEYGQAHEADALAAYEQRYAVMVEPCGLIPHLQYGFLAASPDGLVGERGLVECKCPYRARYTTPSAEYVAQMQLQMLCTERDWCDFVIWRQGEPIITERVMRDPDWLTSNVEALSNFMLEYDEATASKEAAASYLADKERDDAEWREAVIAWRNVQAAAVSIAETEKAARERLIALAPQGAKGCGVAVVKVERAGTIRYADALKSMLPDVDLSPWRGKSSITYQIRESK